MTIAIFIHWEQQSIITYDITISGGAFIFTEAIAAPMPVINEGGTVLPSPTVTNPRSFVLFGMDKFHKIKEQILKEPGKDFYCFISGQISNEPSIYMMEALKIYKIELFVYAQPVKQ